MPKRFFVKKPMQSSFVEIDEEHHGFKRHLGSVQLTAIGIGAIIGAGIFVITGKAAALYAGPAVLVSFLLAFIICLLAGLCFAELAALIPVSGGSYSYAYVALGEFPAWIVGWAVTAQYLVSASTVAVGWSGYLVSFLKDWGIVFPRIFTSSPVAYNPEAGWEMTGAFFNVPAILLVIGLGVLIIVGTKAAAYFTNMMVVIKLSTIFLFVLLGIFFIKGSNWVPFVPDNTGIFGEFGWSGVVRAAGLVFFAYVGFDTVATLAQETKNPQKDLPKAILGSLGICTLAYIVTAMVLTGVVSYKLLNVPDPMAVALNAMGPNFFWVSSLVKFAILAGLASVVLVQLLGQTRVFFAIGKDGLLPQPFCKIHPKTRTPIFGSVVTILIAIFLSGIFSVEILGQLVSMTTLFIFAIVCLGVWILRKTHPEIHRPFRVRWVPFVPALGILACVVQMFCFPFITWVQMILWFAVGILVYFCYGAHHSKLRSERTKFD